MRQKTMLVPTLRETPAEAEIVSHQLMLRAGLIRQLVSGVYTYLPIGYRVLKRIEAIVREEMDAIGAQEILMPAMHPAELWQETGRFDTYGPELVKLYDRHERPFVLGPTHEEVVTDLVRREVNSYKKLPLIVYQIQTKYRDERRPRFGMLRAREFIMKDAYSFDADEDGLAKSYQAMYKAYERIFKRCGLDFRSVEADAGAIGGGGNHEFMVLSENGEDTIVYCEQCGYAANTEKAAVRPVESNQNKTNEAPQTLHKVETPGARTIEEVSRLLNLPPERFIKSIVLKVDDRAVIVLVRGDHEVNEVKVKNMYGADVCEVADEQTVKRIVGAPAGFIGPVGLPGKDVEIVADYAVKGMINAVTGANQENFHLTGVCPGRDFTVSRYGDVRMIQPGDGCPTCGTQVRFSKGMEVGHVFKLNTRYSGTMRATYLNEQGKETPFVMGCYGIGISRTLAAVVEQHHDENGIIWPSSVAPFQVHLIAVNVKDDTQRSLADDLYRKMTEKGWDVLYDDREERAGVKFKDADLIGIPMRVVVGKQAADGVVEYKYRRSGRSAAIEADKLLAQLPALYSQVDETVS